MAHRAGAATLGSGPGPAGRAEFRARTCEQHPRRPEGAAAVARRDVGVGLLPGDDRDLPQGRRHRRQRRGRHARELQEGGHGRPASPAGEHCLGGGRRRQHGAIRGGGEPAREDRALWRATAADPADDAAGIRFRRSAVPQCRHGRGDAARQGGHHAQRENRPQRAAHHRTARLGPAQDQNEREPDGKSPGRARWCTKRIRQSAGNNRGRTRGTQGGAKRPRCRAGYACSAEGDTVPTHAGRVRHHAGEDGHRAGNPEDRAGAGSGRAGGARDPSRGRDAEDRLRQVLHAQRAQVGLQDRVRKRQDRVSRQQALSRHQCCHRRGQPDRHHPRHSHAGGGIGHGDDGGHRRRRRAGRGAVCRLSAELGAEQGRRSEGQARDRGTRQIPRSARRQCRQAAEGARRRLPDLYRRAAHLEPARSPQERQAQARRHAR